MRLSYKRLGDYIRPVDVRNSDSALGENNLYGISVSKDFIISHANLVGVSFENYKVENSILNKSIELDIVSQDEDHLLVGEVKFSKSKQSYRDYKNMIEDTSVPPFSVFKLNDYYLFGESGFNDDLLSVKDSNLHLIDLEKMFNEF